MDVMPTYVYECKTCEKTFEVQQRMSEDPLRDCECGAEGALRRLIQPTAMMFKGGGFHINDYSDTRAEPASEAAACTGEPASCPSCATPAPATDGDQS